VYGCKCNYNINILVCIIFANNSSCFRQIAATNEPFSSKKHIAVTAFIRVYHFVRFTLRGTYTVIICNNIYIYIYIHMLNATMVNRNRPKQEHVGAEMLPDLNWPELLPMPWMALAEFGCPSKIPFIRYINGAWNDLKNYQSAVANALFQHNFYDPPLRDPPEMDTTVTSKIKKPPARRVGQLRIMFPNDFPFAASKSEWHVIL